jgi:putative protein-disulfide isomerase
LSKTLYYVHDPMCSWCWGFSPVLRELLDRLPPDIEVRRLLGGLAPDTDHPMPADLRDKLQATWRHIRERIPETEFNFAFWTDCTPRRATYPACRAVISARGQGPEYDMAMTQAIQRAYYTRALNPSEEDTLIRLAGELGLDTSAFEQRLTDPATARGLMTEIEQARRLGADSFPSLILELGDSRRRIPVDYNDSKPMLELIESFVAER